MFRRFRRHLTIPSVFIVCFLAIQIAIPVAALALPRPARFSWQMYAGVRSTMEFTAVYADGYEREIDVRDYLGNLRLDINFAEVVPEYVCASDLAVAYVRIEKFLNDPATEYPCET